MRVRPIISGVNSPLEPGRSNSYWFTHIDGDKCMQVSKVFNIGYASKLGGLSLANKKRNELLALLTVEHISTIITFTDEGFAHRTNTRLFQFNICFKEKDRSWGEQRLQDLLDEVIKL